MQATKTLKGPRARRHRGDRKKLIQAVHDALYASKICSYAQGMHLIAVGSHEFNWNINLQEMARIWKGGCIIRARFLDTIMQAYERKHDLPNLLLDKEFAAHMRRAQDSWRRGVMTAQHLGIPVPAMAAALNYYDSYRTANLPQNLTQAQRDFFGSHTYERTDKPDAGFVHSEWSQLAASSGGSNES